MSELPEGWAQVPIGTFARIVGGGTPPSKVLANFTPPGQGIPWITPADLSGYREQTIERGARDLSPLGLAACGATLMPKGTVLFSSRAPIGYVAIAANIISTNQGFKSFVLPDGFDPRFTYYQLKHLKPEAEAIATGTTFKELSGAATATLPFKVSPLNEQIRIADQLDTLLARVQACNGRFEVIPALLKRFRQAVLDSATAGDLTHEWRQASQRIDDEGGDVSVHELPRGWNWSCAEEIKAEEQYSLAIGPFGSNLKVSDYTPSGVPLVFVREIRSKTFSGRRSKFVSPSKAESLSAHSIQAGDLLITKMGDPPGDVAVYPSHAPMAIITADCIKLRVSSGRAIAAFIGYAIEATSTRERLLEITSGVAQQKISLARFRRFPLILPPFDEQAEIVRRVEALFKFADRIEARYKAAHAQAQRLSPLVLAKAFRGKLVPQDPNDEPASVLLERIAAEQEVTASQPRRRQSTARAKPARAPKENAAMTKSRQDDDVQGKPYLAKHLRLLGGSASAEALFKASELPVADFYKQLAWEVTHGYLRDGKSVLELPNAA